LFGGVGEAKRRMGDDAPLIGGAKISARRGRSTSKRQARAGFEPYRGAAITPILSRTQRVYLEHTMGRYRPHGAAQTRRG